MALGSNLGDRLANLRNAKKDIARLPGVLPPLRTSAIYETEPVDCEAGATKFLNAVVEFEYSSAVLDLLRELRAIERLGGRASGHERNVSRTIDLDLLYFDDLEIATPELQLPHPRMTDREFVLRPLADVRPDLILPQRAEPIAALLARLPACPAVVKLDAEW